MISAHFLEAAPLLASAAVAFISHVLEGSEKKAKLLLGLLFCLFLFFLALFLFPNLIGSSSGHAYFDIRHNQISLFVGTLMAGSLFAGLFPLRKCITISQGLFYYVFFGVGIIMAINLPTFFLFWGLQRSIPMLGFFRDFRRGSSTGGGTYIFQHLMSLGCFVLLLIFASSEGVLRLPFDEIPGNFYDWKVLLLCFFIIYQSHGIFPFHSWVHDIVGRLPWYEISAIFLPRAGVLFFVQLLLPTLGSDPDSFKLLLLTLSILSSIYWSFRGIFEKNVSKVTTYFYIAQASLLLTGLQADMTAAKGSYLHMMVISIGGTCLWSIMSFIQSEFSLKEDKQFYGLAQFYPRLATLFCLFGFCMIGVPLGASFVVEDLVITGLLHHWPYLGLGHILATCLNGILFFLIFTRIFLGSCPYTFEVRNRDMKLFQMVPYLMGLFVMLLIGILPFLFLEKLKW